MRTLEPTTVRSATAADVAFVHRIGADAFAEYDGARAGSKTLAMAFARAAHTLVAEHAGRRVGFATVTIEGTRAHLVAIAVGRDARGAGVGRRLLRAAERLAFARGAQSIHLETGEANVEAMPLFVGAGYAREGRVARYYAVGYDALRFSRRLP